MPQWWSFSCLLAPQSGPSLMTYLQHPIHNYIFIFILIDCSPFSLLPLSFFPTLVCGCGCPILIFTLILVTSALLSTFIHHQFEILQPYLISLDFFPKELFLDVTADFFLISHLLSLLPLEVVRTGENKIGIDVMIKIFDTGLH